MPATNFKNFNKALNKRTLFPLNRNPFPLAGMKNSLTIYVSAWRKNCFHIQEYLTNGKNCFYQLEKQLLLGAIKLLFRNWLWHSFNNGFHLQKTLNKRMLYHTYRKGFYSFSFYWWKPLFKSGRIQFLKIMFFLLVEEK